MAPKICLASKSAGRNKLFDGARLDFVSIPADIDEQRKTGENAENYVCRLAEEKARVIDTDADFVVGGDTVVVLDGKIFGKPIGEDGAIAMVSSLQGQTHQIISGVAVLHKLTDKVVVKLSNTSVEFSKISDGEIEWYVKNFKPYAFAGAYELNAISSWFVKKVDGSPSNVIGLSMTLLKDCFKELGVDWMTLVKL